MTTSPIRNRRRKGQRGLTLIEIMLVLGIISLLITMVIHNQRRAVDKAKSESARAYLRGLSIALQDYRGDCKSLPPRSDFCQDCGCRGAAANNCGINSLAPISAALQSRSGQPAGWSGPYITNPIPLDPWGNTYLYDWNDARGDGQGSYFWSAGPNGINEVCGSANNPATCGDDVWYEVVGRNDAGLN